jgi:hypothetical protein
MKILPIGYGVFTYALAKEFRKAQAKRETDVSFTELSERVNATMKTLRYDQISDVKGPKAACNALCWDHRPKRALVRLQPIGCPGRDRKYRGFRLAGNRFNY